MSDSTIWAPLPKLVDGRVVEPWQTLGGRRVSLDDPESVEIFREIYRQIHQEARETLERDGRLNDDHIDPLWLEPFDTVLRRTQPDLTPNYFYRFSEPDGYFIEHFKPEQKRGVPYASLHLDLETGALRPDKAHNMRYYGYSIGNHFPLPGPVIPGLDYDWIDFRKYEYGETNVCFTKALDLLRKMSTLPEFAMLEDYRQKTFLRFVDWFDYWISAGHHIRHENPEWDDDPPIPR